MLNLCLTLSQKFKLRQNESLTVLWRICLVYIYVHPIPESRWAWLFRPQQLFVVDWGVRRRWEKGRGRRLQNLPPSPPPPRCYTHTYGISVHLSVQIFRGHILLVIFEFFSFSNVLNNPFSPPPTHPTKPKIQCGVWKGGGAFAGRRQLRCCVVRTTPPSETPFVRTLRSTDMQAMRFGIFLLKSSFPEMCSTVLQN